MAKERGNRKSRVSRKRISRAWQKITALFLHKSHTSRWYQSKEIKIWSNRSGTNETVQNLNMKAASQKQGNTETWFFLVEEALLLLHHQLNRGRTRSVAASTAQVAINTLHDFSVRLCCHLLQTRQCWGLLLGLSSSFSVSGSFALIQSKRDT